MMPRGRRRRATLVLAGLLVAAAFPASPAAAQGRQADVRPPRVEVGGGIGWMGQADAGTRDATLTSNQTGSNPAPFTFFGVSGKTRSGPVAVAAVGGNISRVLGVEGGFQYSRPELNVRIDRDAEGVEPLTISGSSLTQYVVEGNIVYHVNSARFDNRRTVPFFLAGGGSFRQEDEAGVVETGRLVQAGLGFKWFSGVTAARRARGPGLRLDVRYVLRNGGFDLGEASYRSFFTATASATFGL